MKILFKTGQLFVFIILLLLIAACTSKNFIPLYETSNKDTIQTKQTALLITPIQLDLIYHNNQKMNFTPPYKTMVNYRLLPGKHAIEFRYQDIHVNEENEDEIISSQNILLDFTAEAGKTYMANFHKPSNFFEAKKIENEFQITLTQNNQLVATSIYASKSKSKENKPSEKLIIPPIDKDSSIAQLKYWWEKASETEKEAFNQWLKRDPNH